MGRFIDLSEFQQELALPCARTSIAALRCEPEGFQPLSPISSGDSVHRSLKERTAMNSSIGLSGDSNAGSWLSVIAYNLDNLWRRLVLPKKINHWSLTSLQQGLVKTGGDW
jgi:hypothetical protein